MKVYLLLLYILPYSILAQNTLTVNGEPVNYDCAKIKTVDKMDTLTMKKVKVYHAEISNNCLELSIIYNTCKANIELVTDNQVIDEQSLKLYFLLKYIEPILPCETNSKTKVTFDLLPFKNLRTGRFIIISLLGEKYNLMYK